MVGAAKKTLGWYFILADFEEISVIILAFIVYGQHNSRFDEFCGLWTTKLSKYQNYIPIRRLQPPT